MQVRISQNWREGKIPLQVRANYRAIPPLFGVAPTKFNFKSYLRTYAELVFCRLFSSAQLVPMRAVFGSSSFETLVTISTQEE
jgi:hypothetical protein